MASDAELFVKVENIVSFVCQIQREAEISFGLMGSRDFGKDIVEKKKDGK